MDSDIRWLRDALGKDYESVAISRNLNGHPNATMKLGNGFELSLTHRDPELEKTLNEMSKKGSNGREYIMSLPPLNKKDFPEPGEGKQYILDLKKWGRLMSIEKSRFFRKSPSIRVASLERFNEMIAEIKAQPSE